MRHRMRWMALFLLLLPVLSGCSVEPATPEAAAVAANRFMQARADGDAGLLASMLSTKAQKTVSRTQINRHLQEAKASFTALGTPQAVEPGVVRIPVQNLVITVREQTKRWPDTWLTLRYEDDHWRAAWADPLFAEAALAYQNGLFLDALNLGHAIVDIDPHHYRGYLELHFAYAGLKRYREAEWAINQASERATAAQKPDVHDAMARFKLAIKAPAQALSHARQALDLAAPLTPSLYPLRWQADTLVVGARAALQSGDRATAEALANQAGSVDPDNATLAVFRHQLATRPSAPPPAR